MAVAGKERSSIRKKLLVYMASFAGFLLLLLLVGGFLMSAYSKDRFLDQTGKLTRNNARHVAPWVYFEQESRIQEIADTILADPDVKYVRVFTEKGDLLLAPGKILKTERLYDRTQEADNKTVTLTNGQTVLSVREPVLYEIAQKAEESTDTSSDLGGDDGFDLGGGDDFGGGGDGFDMGGGETTTPDDSAVEDAFGEGDDMFGDDGQGEEVLDSENTEDGEESQAKDSEAEAAKDMITIGILEVGYDMSAFKAGRYRLFGGIAVAMISLIGALIFLFRFFNGQVNRLGALVEMATAISEGNLTVEVPESEPDEIGQLYHAFSVMIGRLTGLILSIRLTAELVQDLAKELGQTSGHLDVAVEEETTSIKMASGAVEKLNEAIVSIDGELGKLTHSLEEGASTMLEMGATMEELSGVADRLQSSTDESSASIREIIASQEQVTGSVEDLLGISVENTSAVTEIRQNAESIAENSEATGASSRVADDEAELVVNAVNQVLTGMQEIRTMVENVWTVFGRLRERFGMIQNITDVIDELSSETNLLSLNAAIIAAQAGEHGKGFAVVADEIKDLASRTSTSTQDITNIVDSMEDDVRLTESALKKAVTEVESQEEVSSEARERVASIQESTGHAVSMVDQIVTSIQQQLNGTEQVVKASIHQDNLVQHLSKSMGEIKLGGESSIKTIERMVELSRIVQRSTEEHSQGVAQFQLQMESIQKIAEKISGATTGQRDDAEQVNEIAGTLSDKAQVISIQVEDINRIIDQLGRQSQALQERIQVFRTEKTQEVTPEPSAG